MRAKKQHAAEFTGVPGLYGNVVAQKVYEATSKDGSPYDRPDALAPHQERMALTQTDLTDPTSEPAYGTGGKRVV